MKNKDASRALQYAVPLVQRGQLIIVAEHPLYGDRLC